MSETTDTVEQGISGRNPTAFEPRSLLPNRPVTAPWRPAARSGIGLALAVAEALEARRLFLLLPFAMIAGLITCISASSEPDALALAGGAAAIAFGFAVFWRSLAIVRLLTLAAAFWAGFASLAIHGAFFGTAMLARPAYGTYQARVDEVLTEAESGKRVIVSAITPVDDARPLPVRRARIVVGGGTDVSPGDIIRAPIRFYAVPGPVLPGAFDTQFHSYFAGIGAYGNTSGMPEIVHPGDFGAPERVIDGIRRGIAARIDAALGQPAAGIARAIVNGDQSAVSEEAREVMSTAGLAHVLSISGLHLTLVAGGAYFLLRLLLSLSHNLARQISVKRLAAMGGIVAAVAYFSISGGNVAALRSTLMITLVFVAVLFGRRALTMRNVAIAALAVLVVDPASVFRPSFQLSFAAVVALVGAYETLRSERGEQISWPGTLWRYLGGITITSLVAGSATLLFSIYHFQQTSPLGLLGNLAVLPLVSFIMMPAAAAAVLLMPFGFEQLPLVAMGWAIDRMLDLAAIVTGLSGGFDASPLLTSVSLILGLAALAWFAFFRSWHRLIGPALLVPAVLLFALDRPPDVLIADTTQAVALRFDGGLQVIAGKSESFAVQVWQETYGEPFAARDIACDSVACIAESSAGFRLAIVKDASGFYEECDSADLVITRQRAPNSCGARTVIDADDLARNGVHWLRWEPTSQSFEIRPAIVGLNRPWRAAR